MSVERQICQIYLLKTNCGERHFLCVLASFVEKTGYESQ